MRGIGKIITAVSSAAIETFWPSRCVICDDYGDLLCKSCVSALPFIDPSQACQRCGAPYGSYACTECPSPGSTDKQGVLLDNPFTFDAARCSCTYEAGAKQLVKAYKDAGEQGLGPIIGDLLAATLKGIFPPSGMQVSQDWTSHCQLMVPIPPSPEALRNRGFDHLSPIVSACAKAAGIPYAFAISSTGRALDQRGLSVEQRSANRQESFTLSACAPPIPPRVLILDDVLTTGATANAAAHVLRKAGAQEVFVVTFARVW